MNVRPYLVLWFALAFFLVLVGWGFYHKLTAPPDAPAPPTTAQAPLVERLREERQRRLAERESAAATTVPTTSPAASTTPITQP